MFTLSRHCDNYFTPGKFLEHIITDKDNEAMPCVVTVLKILSYACPTLKENRPSA